MTSNINLPPAADPRNIFRKTFRFVSKEKKSSIFVFGVGSEVSRFFGLGRSTSVSVLKNRSFKIILQDLWLVVSEVANS